MIELVLTIASSTWTYILIPLLALLATAEFISYIKLHRYKTQGVPTKYFPFLGSRYQILSYLNSEDQTKGFCSDSTFSSQGMVAINTAPFFGTSIKLVGAPAIREFAKKENKVSFKTPVLDFDVFGVFFKNGKSAERQRAFISKIFNYNNLRDLYPVIRHTISQTLDQIVLEVRAAPSGQLKLDLKKDVYEKIIKRLSLQVLIGKVDDLEDMEGNHLFDLVKTESEKVFEIFFKNPLTLFTGNVSEIKKCKKKLNEILVKEYRKREKAKVQEDLGFNFLDKVLEHNKKMRAEGSHDLLIDEQELRGNIEMFQFAASDTSYHAASSLATKLALHPKIQNRLYEEIVEKRKNGEQDLLLEHLDNFPYLTACTKEILRLMCPVFSGAPRLVVKDFKLCGKTIYKGDMVCYSPACLHTAEEYFSSPLAFEPERFFNKKLKEKFSYLPFLTGPRICIGQHFGEMLVNMMTLAVVERFELTKDEKCEYKKIISPLYGYEEPFVFLKERNGF